MAHRRRPQLDDAHPPPSDDPDFGGMIAASTEAEARRVVIVCDHFIATLLRDPRVVVLFDRWGALSELSVLAIHAHESRAAAGHWTPEQELLVERLAAVHHAGGEILAPSPWQFVERTLGLSHALPDGGDAWLWLAKQLLARFTYDVIKRAIGRPGVLSIGPKASVAVVVPTLPTTISRAFADSSTDAALLDILSLQWLRRDPATVRTAAPPRGRAPKENPHYLQAWAEWFYALEVQAPPSTIATLARSYLAGQPDRHIEQKSAEREVAHGRAEARRLLELIRV